MELSSVGGTRIRLLPLGWVAKAPMMAVVQPVIKHERRERGQVRPARGIVYDTRLEIEQLVAGHAGVVR
jgi:hypothetical protein